MKRVLYQRVTSVILSVFIAVSTLFSFPFNIVADSSNDKQIESVVFENITIIENTNGYETTDFDFETGEFLTYYRYNYQCPAFTVTFEDGTVKYCPNGFIEIKNEWFYPNLSDEQSYSPWTLGENYVTAEVLGITTTVIVEIIENPLLLISVNNVSMYENTNGYTASDYNEETGEYDLEYYRYSCNLSFTVTFKDGTIKASNGNYIEIFGTGYNLNVLDTQSYTSQWGVGVYAVEAELFGIKDTFAVIIRESPILSISVDNVNIIEGTSGYDDTEYNPETGEYVVYYKYSYYPSFIVTFKDGTTERAESGIYIDEDWYSLWINDEQSYENQWGLGAHLVTASIMGASDTFAVIIEKTPVISIDVKLSRNMYEGLDLANSVFQNLSLSILLNDGTSICGKAQDIAYTEGWLSINTEQCKENGWKKGEYTATVTFMNYTQEFKVTIEENPFESIDISGINELEILFKKKDGQAITAKVLDWTGGMYFAGTLVTDQFIFGDASFNCDYYNDEYIYEKNLSLTIGTVSSNTLDDNKWLKVQQFAGDLIFATKTYKGLSNDIYGENFEYYDHELSEYDINALINISGYLSDLASTEGEEYIEDGGWYFYEKDINTVAKAIEENFGKTNLDLTKASGYNAQNNKIKLLPIEGGGPESFTECYYKDGEWHIESFPVGDYGDYYLYKKRTYKLDENLIINNIEFLYETECDIRDLVRVKKYIAGIKTNIRTYDDYNQDCKIDLDDIIELRKELIQ